MHRNLNSSDYAQKPQRNCTFINSASGLLEHNQAALIKVLRSFDNPLNIVQKTEVVSMFYLAFLIRRPA
jgi:hypothetical protein